MFLSERLHKPSFFSIIYIKISNQHKQYEGTGVNLFS